MKGLHPRPWAALLVAVLVALPPAAHAVAEDPAPAVVIDEDFAAGRQAIERKDWARAVTSLQRALKRHPDDAELHNALGYAHRNLKQMDLAFTHYRRALALDPRHRGAHEYLGEAYLMVGDLAGAQKQVAALRAICLLPCEELADLEKAIAAWRAQRK